MCKTAYVHTNFSANNQLANNYGYQGGNYTTTSYGGGGGNEGGGFMNGSQQGSQDSPGQSKVRVYILDMRVNIDGFGRHMDRRLCGR